MDAKDKRIAELEAQLNAALDRIELLESALAASQKNSGNSSKPPSSDIVKPPKPKGKGRRKRKIGAQKGHKKHSRIPFAEDQLDIIIPLTLDCCPRCNGTLTVSDTSTKVDQQVELVGRKYIITEYRRPQYLCDACQRVHFAPRPPKLKSGLFGENLIATTAYLKGHCHMSYTKLRDHFRDLYGICISTGFLANQIRKASRALQAPYDELLNQLPNEESIHIDETGGKENGDRRWIWCFRSRQFTLFRIDVSRGHIVLKEVLGTDYPGIIICDFHGAYQRYIRLYEALLQLCWAHLIREVKYIAQSKVKRYSNWANRLLAEIGLMFKTIHLRGKILESTWYRRMLDHRDEILRLAWHRLSDNNDAYNIAIRLWNWQCSYFRFIDSDVPPTNNLAEQAIRQVVIDRKITQGTRSDWGNRWQERIWTVLSTCAQTGRNVLSFLRESVSAMLQRTPAPSLLEK